jgi:DNA-binding response OmpR family regulator
MAKILIIEDDKKLAEGVIDWLAMEKHTIDHAESGEDGLQLLSNFSYDLVILDWNLPGIDGLEVCRRLRAEGSELPILFLTAQSKIENVETGLDAGADDYLQKPFQVRELSARIRSLMRRPKGLLTNTVTAGYLTVELDSHYVGIGDKKFALLEFFIRNPNKFFSSKALLASVWPSDSESAEESVRTIMFHLRKKITPQGETCLIKTVQGSGYIYETDTTGTRG